MGKQGSLANRARAQMERHRDEVYSRDWRECVASGRLGLECSHGLTLQHRVNRGMGGSAAVGDGPQWYVTMCAVHNAALEQTAQAQLLARHYGWSIRPGHDQEQRLLSTPVFYPDGTWWLLDADGWREQTWPSL